VKVMEKKKLSIGLIGLGTVGTSVVKILNKRRSEFLKCGYELLEWGKFDCCGFIW